MLYGESFSIFKKNNRWLKIKIKEEDGYKGFIKNKNFSQFIKPSHKMLKKLRKMILFIGKDTWSSQIRNLYIYGPMKKTVASGYQPNTHRIEDC